ncbi:phage terminase large subunit family protein [Methylosinus sp. PW1]|uniref:phage terminase large subunit family protein n=1 Tax=Methylosinus sp. PW1 TaxID=107636 RepID=UPI0006907B24|nr:terminase gpA endonuclease subunit [Methylosinus sp. PW1]
MTLKFRISALAVVAGTLAAVITPPQRVAPADWAAENLIVPDGPRAGQLWDPSETPYIVEPLNFLGPDTGVNELAVMKGVQSGFTTLLIAAIGHTIDREPCRMAILQPTDGALSDFNRDKLQIAIDGTKSLAAKVVPQTSRSAQGSTTYSKKYPGGSLDLLLASSAADLRSKTLKKLFRDEIDEYADDLNDQGDPLELSDGRLTSFLKSGDWKKADISTPTIKGASKIEARHALGDKRRWHVPCPHCTDDQGQPSLFVLDPLSANFVYERQEPYAAYYVAPCCGAIIREFEKRDMVRKGRWVATDPRPGAFPSYHFDSLSSPFVPWPFLAKKIVDAGDDPKKLKALYNLWFGLPYEIKGDAPDHVRLMERRAEFPRGHIPPRGLMLVAAADVQMRGIWLEILAVAPDRQSWPIDALYLDGSTESPDGEAFEKLKAQALKREFSDAFGRKRRIDALGVDSGYRSHVVYAWVRANQEMHPDTGNDMVLALDGRDGWGRPAIGMPTLVDIDLAGKKIKQGAKLWPVGTWPLKGAFYADLHKEGLAAGRERDPEGYCHFGAWLDETYFRQITSEYLADEKFKGRTRKVWKLRPSEKDNHLLDCRVYNNALAEYLGLSSTTPEEWALLAKRRGVPQEAIAQGLFAPRAVEVVVPALALPAPVQQAPADEVDDDPFARLAALNRS